MTRNGSVHSTFTLETGDQLILIDYPEWTAGQ